jgi:hypothetical protein
MTTEFSKTEDPLNATYRCTACNSNEFDSKHYYVEVKSILETQSCRCGATINGISAERHIEISAGVEERGPLDEHHRCSYEESEEVERLGEEQVSEEIHCESCFNPTDRWDMEEDGIREESHEYFVLCSGCDREIEFGWSHPDRGGRIWPCESDDFNPYKCWPEPKYREIWGKKGWLSPRFNTTN